MRRKNVLFALCLFNAAVLMAAIMFLPRRTGFGFGFNNEFERAVKHFLYSVPWGQVVGVVVISVLISAAIYLFTAGVHGSRSSDSHNT